MVVYKKALFPNLRQKIILPVFFVTALILLLYDKLILPSALYELRLLFTFPIVVLILLHMAETLSLKRGLILYFWTIFVAFVAEVKGVHGEGAYSYMPAFFEIIKIPVSVLMWWGILVYTCYSVTNSFLAWTDRSKPSKKVKNSYIFIPLIVILDGVLVSSIALILDPVATLLGKWTWFVNVTYFGSPLYNFRGWFLVATASTFVFRSYEYFSPKKGQENTQVHIWIVLFFAIFNLSFSWVAFAYDMVVVAVVGAYVTVPIVLLNLFLFFTRRKQLKIFK